MEGELIGIVAALGSALAWAVGLILLKKVRDDVSALGLTLVTGLLGLLLLGGWLATTDAGPMPRRAIVILGLSGLLGFAAGDALFFAALGQLRAHLVVLFGVLGQAFTVVLAVVWLGEVVTPPKWLAIAMMVAGVAAALWESQEEEEEGRSTTLGVVYGLASVAVISVSVIIAKQGLEQVSAAQGTFVRILWGTAGIAALGLVSGRTLAWLEPFRRPEVLGRVLAAAVVATFGGFWLFHVALKNVDVAVANPLASAEPLFILPLAALFLGESISRRAIVGTAVAVAGAVLLCV
jgi:drug/metabolite transporter (DMT)-like permease